MNQLPYMPLYWNDLLSDNKVRIMSNEELGAYVRLLGAAWHEDIPGTLPDNEDDLCRFAGVEPSLWRKLSRRVLACFVLNGQTGRYEQKRMMEEYAKCVAQMEMKRARATAGAAKRWGDKPEQSPAHAQAMLKHTASNASQNQNQKDTYTERPQGMPATPEEAVARVQTAGLPSEFVVGLWEQLEGRGWVDGAGQRVTNFPMYAKSRFTKHQDSQGRERARSKSPTAAPRAEPTGAEIAAWLVTVPDYAAKRGEWTSVDAMPSFARAEFAEHRRKLKLVTRT